MPTHRPDTPALIADPTPSGHGTVGRRVDWRGRGIVLLQFTLLACIANSLALQLPGSTPFLVGNMAAVAVAMRFGLRYALPTALCTSAITGEPQWVALAVLECLLVAHWRDRPWRTLTLWCRVWLPLAPLVAWITLPRGADDPLLWAGSIAVVFATGATSLVGGRQLARLTRSRRQRARQPMALQLSVQLSTLMAAPATLVIALLVQWGHQHDLQRTALGLDGQALGLAGATAAEVRSHRDAVAQGARVVPALGAKPVLEQMAELHPGFLSLLRTDRRGRVEVSLRRGEPARASRSDVSDRDYFRDTMASGRATVTPVFRGRGIGTDVIVAVAAPVPAADGSPDGVLQGALALGRLARVARDDLDAIGLHYVVTDAAGRVALTSLPDLPLLSSPNDAAARLDGARAQPWWATRAFAAPLLSFDGTGQSLVVTRDVEGIGWRARALQPLRPLERRQTLRSLLAAAFVLALILGLGRLAQRFADSHARGLAQVVSRLRGLDPSIRASGLAGTMDAKSAELSELIRDFEATESRLQTMHAALVDAAAQQQALNRELEARVEQRTAELREALGRAEHLAAAKSGFLANMSHELRTPLAAILGYSEHGLRETASAAEMRRSLQTVVRHGRHLLDIVNDVLDASKIEAGQLRVQQQRIAPLSPIADAMELLRPRALEKGLQLVLSAHWPLPAEVLADPLRLKQVLLNLLSNAIKFTAHGFVAVRVRAAADEGQWSIEVEDTGIGMDAAQCERVFQRFEQADDSTTRRFGGTGLGLYISRQLARQMGGELSARSTPGHGSRFLVSLPIGLDPEWVEDGEALPTTDTRPPTPVPRLGGRVLVADDVADLRGLLRARIAATGAEVVEARDGREALERIAAQAPDLVLMDMHMPEMDGREAVYRLRRDGLRVPIYACSADVMDEDVAAFMALGCDGALAKPIDSDALYAVLSRHLPSAPAHEASARHGGAPVTDAAPDPLAAAMAQVRQRFLERVPAERAALAAALEALRIDGDRAALRQLAHRLKGSAGTFGFDSVGAAAAALDRAARTASEPVEAVANALDRQLADLHCAPDPARPEDAPP